MRAFRFRMICNSIYEKQKNYQRLSRYLYTLNKRYKKKKLKSEDALNEAEKVIAAQLFTKLGPLSELTNNPQFLFLESYIVLEFCRL